MNKFLLDANLSPLTKEYLQKQFSLDVKDLITEGKYYLSDLEVTILAKKEKRIIITFDLDFGEIYHEKEKGTIGVIILRIKDQTVESVNQTLSQFFTSDANEIHLMTSLVIIEENRVRVYKNL